MKTNRMKFIATFLLIVMQVGLIAQKTLSANLQTGSQTASNQSICVYPNPMQGKSTISFLVKQTGNTQLDVYSIDGKKVISTSENLQKGRNSFQLSLPNGIYMIQVTGNGFSYSTKVINQTKNKTKPEVVFAGIDNTEIPVADDSQYPAGINSMGVPGGNGIYGQDFLGGKIAYLLKSSDPGYVAGKDRGIVMSKVDLSTSAIWGCQGTLIPNLDYSTWNTGCSNNNAIVTGCSTPSIAAALCQSYSSDGYGSWYLPSIDELLKIDQEMSNNFTYADYWSSTQINSNEVVTYNFSNNAQMYALKSESKRVRAVKTFSVDAPTLTTTGVTSITSTSAVCGVSITNDGGAPIILRGVCWSTSPNPTNRNGNLPNGNGTGIGTFSVSMTNLIPNTTYYVRAWAITIFGTTYSSQTAFTTPLVVGASYEGGIIAYILA